MDVRSLVIEARARGLRLHVDANKLVIRGPKALVLLAHKLIEHRAAVVPIVLLLDQDTALHRLPTRRPLLGGGFAARRSKTPPAQILADPVVMCTKCRASIVLPELTEVCGGLCFGCSSSRGS